MKPPLTRAIMKQRPKGQRHENAHNLVSGPRQSTSRAKRRVPPPNNARTITKSQSHRQSPRRPLARRARTIAKGQRKDRSAPGATGAAYRMPSAPSAEARPDPAPAARRSTPIHCLERSAPKLPRRIPPRYPRAAYHKRTVDLTGSYQMLRLIANQRNRKPKQLQPLEISPDLGTCHRLRDQRRSALVGFWQRRGTEPFSGQPRKSSDCRPG